MQDQTRRKEVEVDGAIEDKTDKVVIDRTDRTDKIEQSQCRTCEDELWREVLF